MGYSQGLFPVLSPASLSHSCMQWLITVIPLWLKLHHNSLVLKNWHWHISSFLRCSLTVLPPLQTHQESAFPLLAVFSVLWCRASKAFLFCTVEHSAATKGDSRRTEQVKPSIRYQSPQLLKQFDRLLHRQLCCPVSIFLPGWIKAWVGSLFLY